MLTSSAISVRKGKNIDYSFSARFPTIRGHFREAKMTQKMLGILGIWGSALGSFGPFFAPSAWLLQGVQAVLGSLRHLGASGRFC